MSVLLVDVDGMFASCEQVFDPTLKGKPVVVLSNNDGCVVAANREAKALGKIMWKPYFQIKAELATHNVAVRSSNFELYSDLSNRLMSLLQANFKNVEPYSVDEAFVELPDSWNAEKIARDLKQQIMQEVKLPVSIGVAATKTLAKVASRKAKNDLTLGGVLDLTTKSTEYIDSVLKSILVEDVWGIGRKLNRRMQALGVLTAYDLKLLDPIRIRKKFNILVEQTVREIQGQKCIPVELPDTPHKNLLHSRLLATPTNDINRLEDIISFFTYKVSDKLIQFNRYAKTLTLALYTDRFGSEFVKHDSTIVLDVATNDQVILTKHLKQILKKIFNPNTFYNRVMIYCGDLETRKPNALIPNIETDKSLTKTLSMINNKFGQSTINFGSAVMPERIEWSKRQNHLSKRSSTRIEEISKIIL